MGRYGIPTPSTYSTGVNLWPWNNSPSMPPPNTAATPRIGRAPWRDLSCILEEQTESLSPPPVKLSVYHPLQTRSLTNSPNPTSPNKSGSPHLMSPKISTQTRINKVLESSSDLSTEGKKTPSMSMGRISSGPNLPQSTEKSWAPPEPTCGRSDEGTSKPEPPITFLGPENPWTSTSPYIEENPSMPPMPPLSRRQLSPTCGERYGTLHQGTGYPTYIPGLLMNKVPWSMPSPVSFGKNDLGGVGPTSRFPQGYVADYDVQPMPNVPPNWWQQGTQYQKGKSRRIVGGDHEMEPGGSGAPHEPSDAERLQWANELYDQMRQKADRLEDELAKIKGKGLGRDPLRRTSPQTDQFSLPRPDNYQGPPDKGPSGTYDPDE